MFVLLSSIIFSFPFFILPYLRTPGCPQRFLFLFPCNFFVCCLLVGSLSLSLIHDEYFVVKKSKKKEILGREVEHEEML